MAIEVKLPTLLRVHAGGTALVTAEGATIGEVFADLAARYPDLGANLLDGSGAIHKFVNVYRNDDDIRYLDALDTKVADGDVISILPAVAGGSERAPSGAGSDLHAVQPVPLLAPTAPGRSGPGRAYRRAL